jgi:probable rRNA maturation factor
MSDLPDIEVTIYDDQALAVDQDRIAGVARRTAMSEEAAGELSIMLVTEEKSAELNDKFMGEEGPTDVLAFPIDGKVEGPKPDSPVVIGELVVCPAYIAESYEAGSEAFVSELDLVVAHGVLHLLGHDHDTEENTSVMREAEKKITGRSGATAP